MQPLKFILLPFAILITYPSQSQVTQEWVQRYDAQVYTEAYFVNKLYPFMELDNAGNIYIAGTIDSDPGPNYNADFVVIKCNPEGVQQWIKTYDGQAHGDNYLADLKVDGSGNVYITGSSFVNLDSLNNVTTIKYNTLGAVQWINIYDSPYHKDDIPAALDADNSGNVTVTGITSNSSQHCVLTMKINSSGILSWSRIEDFCAPGGTGGIDITFDNAGNIAVLLAFNPFEVTTFCVYKLNYNGDSLWCLPVASDWKGGRTIGIKSDSSGNFSIAGNSAPYFSGLYVGYVRKINPSGNIIWSCSYTDIGYSREIKDFCTDNAGSIFTTGSFTQSGTKYLTSKFSNGTLDWTKFYANYNNGGSTGTCIDKDRFGYIYVSGYSYGLNTDYDFATVKYNLQGDSIWSIRYNHSANLMDNASSIKIDTGGNVYVAGVSYNSTNSKSYTIVKYNQLTSIKNISSEIPFSFKLYQNYPNPFNPATRIKFAIPLSRGVSEGRGVYARLIIYDVLGRETAVLVNEQLKPGTYEVEWDGSNYTSGVYFYKLTVGDASAPLSITYSETKKMVLMK